MRIPYNMLSAVGLVVLLLGAPALQALAASPPSPTAVTVRDGLRGFRLVDPQTGEEVWRAGDVHDDVSNLIVGPDGRAFASVVDADGSGTAVYAVTPGASDAAPIGRVPGRAVVAAVDPAGGQIRLLELPPPTQEDFLSPPTAVLSLPLPAGRVERAPAALARDDEGFGILSPDGERWYGFEPSSTAWDAPYQLVALTFRDGEATERETLLHPGLGGRNALLLALDGRTLYVVDYLGQVIQVVGGSPLAVLNVAGFGRYATKRPPCAAVVAPRGDRLFVLGNSGSTNAGDGILVYETEGWRVVGHYLPGRNFHCLTISPDGSRLYASSTDATPSAEDPWLMTIDAATGKEQESVPLNLDDASTSVGPVTVGGLPAEGPAHPTTKS